MEYKYTTELKNFQALCTNTCILKNTKTKLMTFEYYEGNIYECNKSEILGGQIFRVFIGKKYPICKEFTKDFFNKHFKIINI